MKPQILGLSIRHWGRVAVFDTGIYPEHQDQKDIGTFDETAQIMDVSTCDALDALQDFVTNGTPTVIDQLNGITLLALII